MNIMVSKGVSVRGGSKTCTLFVALPGVAGTLCISMTSIYPHAFTHKHKYRARDVCTQFDSVLIIYIP